MVADGYFAGIVDNYGNLTDYGQQLLAAGLIHRTDSGYEANDPNTPLPPYGQVPPPPGVPPPSPPPPAPPPPGSPGPGSTGTGTGSLNMNDIFLANDGHIYRARRDPTTGQVTGYDDGGQLFDYNTGQLVLGADGQPISITTLPASQWGIPPSLLDGEVRRQMSQRQSVQRSLGPAGAYQDVTFDHIDAHGGAVFVVTNRTGQRVMKRGVELVAEGAFTQSDITRIEQDEEFRRNRVAQQNRSTNIRSNGNGSYTVDNPDGSRTTKTGQELIGSGSATAEDLKRMDDEKTQADIAFQRQQSLAGKYGGISYGGAGKYSATDYNGNHQTFAGEDMNGAAPTAEAWDAAKGYAKGILTATGSATESELTQAREDWGRQESAADRMKKLGQSRYGQGLGFAGSQPTRFAGQ